MKHALHASIYTFMVYLTVIVLCNWDILCQEIHAETEEEVDDQSVTVTHEWYLAVSKISIIMACKYVAEIWSRLTVCVVVKCGMA